MAKPKIIESSYEGASRIDQEQHFSGTAVVYGATVDDHCCFQCDFELDTYAESHPEQTRSNRLISNKAAPRIKDDQLKHELVVLFGPEMSASNAVVTLKRLAQEIERGGLLIGRGKDDDFLTELVDGRVE